MSSFARSLGKTLAYLSFDDEYKQMRVRRLQQQPSRLPQSLCQAGSSFAMGVCLGLSGVILHPLRGTKEEGVEGFFKGIGKGLMGLITKPTGGAVDMVSMAFDGLRRSAEMGEDVVHRMRLPRYIHPLGLRPFSTYQSVGMKILHTVMKTGNQDSDIYWAHAALTREEKSDVVLVTDRRVFLLKKCKSWGEWSVEWDVLLSSLTDLPLVLDGKLILRLRKNDLETSWKVREDKELSSTDEELLNWIQKRISKAMKL